MPKNALVYGSVRTVGSPILVNVIGMALVLGIAFCGNGVNSAELVG